jgi:hypothetical protein
MATPEKNTIEENQPNPYAALQEQAARHEAEYAKEEAFWKKTYDGLVAEKANLYKADPKLAENKRREAALKTLVGAFGSLADTIAVANGGTAPLRDYRQDISQTHRQADALDQGERAKETAAYQNYLDRLEKLMNKRPKWTKNDALLRYADMISRDENRKSNHAFQEAQQKRQQDFTAGENEKNRAASQTKVETQQQGANQRAAGKGENKEPKQSEIATIPLTGNRQLILPKSLYNNGTALERWISRIYSNEIFDANTRNNLRNIFAQMGQFDRLHAQQAELGYLLEHYPQFEKILEGEGHIKYLNPAGATTVPSDPNVPASPAAQSADTPDDEIPDPTN